MMRRYADNIRLNPNSYYGPGFILDIRFPEKEKIYLETGEHCVLVNEIRIDDDVTIAWDCLIYDHNSHSVEWEERKNDTEQEYQDIKNGLNPITHKNWDVVKSAPIHICSKAWIGTGVKILKGVTVGEGAVVAAGSVVVKDVEPWTMVGGNPAKLIKLLQ